ncbi:hypothetical protein [Nitrobacter sp.]|uniref:hypothetical protein n=1 Tax=Nitrobacter sp. TaxID=29420 RepID=UPI0029CAC2D4|nr:hypothetical protein [Nitrobacter sp.]
MTATVEIHPNFSKGLISQQQREHEKIRKLIAAMLESIRAVTEATSKLHRLVGNSEVCAEIVRLNSVIARCQNDLASRLPALRNFVKIEQSLIALNRDYTPEVGTESCDACRELHFSDAVQAQRHRQGIFRHAGGQVEVIGSV